MILPGFTGEVSTNKSRGLYRVVRINSESTRATYEGVKAAQFPPINCAAYSCIPGVAPCPLGCICVQGGYCVKMP